MNAAGPCGTNRGDFKLVVALTLFCAALYLPGIASLPATDRDEARFAQATYQMLESGDFWRIAFQDELRTKKPHGIHWLQALSVTALSQADAKEIWAYRLPSALGAWLSVVLAFLLGRDLIGRRGGMVAALFLAAAPLVVAEAHIATTDAVLLACILASQLALARAYGAGRTREPAGWANAVVFWAGLAGATLVKGPIGPMVVGLTALGLIVADRRAGWLATIRPFAGLAVLAAIVAAWAWRAALANEGTFVGGALEHDLFSKILLGQESHGAPPGTHALIATVGLGAAFPFALFGLVHALRNRRHPAFRFCLAWIVPSWIVFELVATKLPHYALPMYPALAILAAAALRAGALDGLGGRLMLVLSACVAAVAALAAIGWSGAVERAFGLPAVDIAALASAALIASVGVGCFGWRRRPRHAAAVSLTGWAVLAVAILSVAGTRAAPLWISQRLADAAVLLSEEMPGPLVAVGYEEPSLVFDMRRDVEFMQAGEAARRARAAEPPVIAVDDASRAAFEAALGGGIAPAAGVSGYQYAKGRWTTVWLYAPSGPAD